MILAILLTVHALKDSLVIRAGELLTDTTYAPLVPHDPNMDGMGGVLWGVAVKLTLDN